MSAKPVIPRERANRDVEEAVDYYALEADESVADRFIDALESAYRTIGARPATGSSRYAHELNLPGLRTRMLRRFPYLIFYIERDDRIDVWRVLHAQRDIPAWMREPGDFGKSRVSQVQSLVTDWAGEIRALRLGCAALILAAEPLRVSSFQ